MQFKRVNSGETGVTDLIKRLEGDLLSDKHVLWLISGGSNIGLAVRAMDNLPDNLKHRLTVMLVDERYGEVGHQNSNHQQLLDAGFKAGEARLVEILQANLSLADTEQRFRTLTAEVLDQSDSVIAQLGIGEDGHIAGILPHSPAANEETELAIGYQSQPFQRLTLTFPALRQVDIAYCYAFGSTKLSALTKLKLEQLSLTDQPAQILKQINTAYVYNDLID